MKRIFLSALIGVGMVAAIFQGLSGSEAARTQQSYPLVCRGSANLAIGTAPGEGNIGFVFTRGSKPASQGLAPGGCSWVDRGVRAEEPDRLSQHVANGTQSLSGGNLAPENRWYQELHSPDNYWTFQVYSNGQGQLIVTSARSGRNGEPDASAPGRLRRLVDPVKLDGPEPKPADRSKLPDDPKVKSGDRLTFADDPKLKWHLVNPYGIDMGDGSFHAGRTLDVLVTKGGGVIAASETGGVWLLPPSGSGIPLSRDWENTEVNCLAFGPDGEGHVYAGLRNIGGSTTLMETDTSKPVALRLIAPWKSISLPGAVGSIYQIAVVPSLRMIALACDGGVYWSSVPAAGGTYAWSRAEGLPAGAFFSVAETNDRDIVAGAWGNPEARDLNGIFVGRLNSPGLGDAADLVMHRAIMTGGRPESPLPSVGR